MEPTAPPPPPHTSSSSASAATAAASFASPNTLSSSTSPSATQSHSPRRFSPYPPPMPGRGAASSLTRQRQVTPSSSPAGSSRGARATATLYEEICSIRRSSAEFLAQMDAMAEAHRADARARQPRPLLHLHGGPQQLLHLQERPSSSSAAVSGLPPLPSSSQQPSPSFTTRSPLTPRGGFSGNNPSSPWQQHLEWPSSGSATSGQPDLPTGGVSGYAPSFSQLQQVLPSFTTAGKPDPPFLPQQQLHGPSSTPVQPNGISFFGNASSSQLLHQQQQEGSSSMASCRVDVFAQSSSTSQQQYELPPLPPSLQWPILPVKQQEPIFHSSTERLEPELIHIDEEMSADGLDDLMRSYFDESSSHARGLNDLVDMPQSSSSSGDRSSLHEGVNGAVQPSSWGAAETNIGQSSNTSTVPKLRLGGMPLPSPVASASSSRPRTNANGKLFTDAEMDTIQKDERLKELVNTDPKRVKTILSNRASAAKTYSQRKTRRRDLELQIEALQIKNMNLSSELQSEQDKLVELKSQNDQLRVRLQQLEMQAKIKDAQTKALQAEIESLKRRIDRS